MLVPDRADHLPASGPIQLDQRKVPRLGVVHGSDQLLRGAERLSAGRLNRRAPRLLGARDRAEQQYRAISSGQQDALQRGWSRAGRGDPVRAVPPAR